MNSSTSTAFVVNTRSGTRHNNSGWLNDSTEPLRKELRRLSCKLASCAPGRNTLQTTSSMVESVYRCVRLIPRPHTSCSIDGRAPTSLRLPRVRPSSEGPTRRFTPACGAVRFHRLSYGLQGVALLGPAGAPGNRHGQRRLSRKLLSKAQTARRG